MQFPVPQFTDVEDRIIGPLTIRQFVILLVSTGVVLLCWSLSKDYYVTGAAGLLVGAPGLAIAFGQFNGRPMYSSMFVFLNHYTKPKFFTFQKQATSHAVLAVKDLERKADSEQKSVETVDARSRLKNIQFQLAQREKQEEELLSDKSK